MSGCGQQQIQQGGKPSAKASPTKRTVSYKGTKHVVYKGKQGGHFIKVKRGAKFEKVYV